MRHSFESAIVLPATVALAAWVLPSDMIVYLVFVLQVRAEYSMERMNIIYSLAPSDFILNPRYPAFRLHPNLLSLMMITNPVEHLYRSLYLDTEGSY